QLSPACHGQVSRARNAGKLRGLGVDQRLIPIEDPGRSKIIGVERVADHVCLLVGYLSAVATGTSSTAKGSDESESHGPTSSDFRQLFFLLAIRAYLRNIFGEKGLLLSRHCQGVAHARVQIGRSNIGRHITERLDCVLGEVLVLSETLYSNAQGVDGLH